jgi:glucan 1,3-beta-glucosidase
MPTIKASSSFTGSWVIDGDPYNAAGNREWIATNIFWRQIRNIIFDVTEIPAGQGITVLHWPTSQATSLQNVVVNMSEDPGTTQVGMLIESGSGGLVNDLVFNGGDFVP